MTQLLVPWKIQRVDKDEMVSLNSWSCKGGWTQNALQRFYFVFEFRNRRTIKRDANLVGLRKIECSSIKIKSKERHSTLHEHVQYLFETFGVGTPDESRNSRRSEVLMLSHLACTVTVDVGCPDVSRNSRQSEVSTQVGSPDIGGSAGRLSVLIGTPDVRWKFRLSKVPTQARSPGISGAG